MQPNLPICPDSRKRWLGFGVLRKRLITPLPSRVFFSPGHVLHHIDLVLIPMSRKAHTLILSYDVGKQNNSSRAHERAEMSLLQTAWRPTLAVGTPDQIRLPESSYMKKQPLTSFL